MEKYIDLLDHVRIATPCTAKWEEMTGTDQTRFCAQCNLNVHNLSAMPRAEAEAFVEKAEGRVCIRLYRRTDGTILTEDCPVGLRAVRQRMYRSIRRVAATVVTLVAGMIGFGSTKAWSQGDMIMGKMMPYVETPVDSTEHQDTVVAQPEPDTLDYIEQGGMMIMGEMAVPEEVIEPTISENLEGVEPRDTTTNYGPYLPGIR